MALERFWIGGELQGGVFVSFAELEDWLLKDSVPSVNLSQRIGWIIGELEGGVFADFAELGDWL